MARREWVLSAGGSEQPESHCQSPVPRPEPSCGWGEALFEPAGSQDPLCCPPPALWDPLAPPCWHRYVRAEAEEKVDIWLEERRKNLKSEFSYKEGS